MRPLLLLAVPATLALAADHEVRLRLGLQALPGEYRAEDSGGFTPHAAEWREEREWDSTGRLAFDIQWTPHARRVIGFGLGIGLGASRSRDDGERDFALDQYGIWIEPTLLLAPTRWLNLEFANHLGGGVARMRSDGGYRYERGASFEMGLTARLVIALHDRYEAFIAGGHLFGDSEADWTYDGRTGDTFVEFDGVWYGLGAGIRL